jgi:pyrimidine operon attenuation protein/uracil phosphoribosyltransferase
MRVLADAQRVGQLVDGLASSLRARVSAAAPTARWAIIGIRSRGDVLAQRLAAKLGPQVHGGRVGCLDITLYRDDLSEVARQPIVRTTEVPFDVDGLEVVLVDDVLMTGRSIRAALQSLMDLGRPRRVWLAVLVDRGGRELPIAADDVALDLSSSNGQAGLQRDDHIQVQLQPTDTQDAIVVRDRGSVA